MKTKHINYVTSKPDTQAMIKALRASGLKVIKDSLGAYRSTMTQHQTKNGVRTGSTRELVLFSALPGRGTYLIRRVENLFGDV